MTTEKQIKANRENAKKGGVKTPEGKAIVRYNALKHGLLSKEVLLEGEDEKSLVELRKKLYRELKPASELELILVDRIVANTWRLKRAIRVEREMIIDDCNEEDWQGNIKKKNLGEAFSYDFVNYDTYGKFIRYETSIERGIYRALHELQRIQSARKGEKPPAPVAIDVDVSTDK
jgi:hypothetical protein